MFPYKFVKIYLAFRFLSFFQNLSEKVFPFPDFTRNFSEVYTLQRAVHLQVGHIRRMSLDYFSFYKNLVFQKLCSKIYERCCF